MASRYFVVKEAAVPEGAALPEEAVLLEEAALLGEAVLLEAAALLEEAGPLPAAAAALEVRAVLPPPVQAVFPASPGTRLFLTMWWWEPGQRQTASGSLRTALGSGTEITGQRCTTHMPTQPWASPHLTGSALTRKAT